MVTAVSDPTSISFNAYVDVAEAATLVEILPTVQQTIWAAATSAQQNAALVYSSQFLDYTVEFPIEYTRVSAEQNLEFPKNNVPVEGVIALRRVSKHNSSLIGYKASDKYDNYLYRYDENYLLRIIANLNQTNPVTNFAATEIPQFIKDVTVELAIIHLDNGTIDDLSVEQIKRVKLDVIEIEYFNNIVKSRGGTIFQKLAKWGGYYRADLAKPQTDDFRKGGKVGF